MEKQVYMCQLSWRSRRFELTDSKKYSIIKYDDFKKLKIEDWEKLSFNRIQPNTKIYPLKYGSKVTRFILKDFLSKNPTITKTNKKENADTVIVSLSYLKNFIYRGIYEQELYLIPRSKIDIPFADIDNSEIYCSNHGHQFEGNSIGKCITSKYNELAFERAKEYMWLESVYGKKNIVLDEYLFDDITKDSIKLDNETYENLDSLFSSGNKDSIDLGMKILSELNLEENKIYILILLNKHKNLLLTRGKVKVWENMKNLLNSIREKYKVKFYDRSWYEFIPAMYKTFNIKGSEYENILYKYLLDMVNKECKMSNLDITKLEFELK